jgi:hypothetical protein
VPDHSSGNRTEKSPLLSALNACKTYLESGSLELDLSARLAARVFSPFWTSANSPAPLADFARDLRGRPRLEAAFGISITSEELFFFIWINKSVRSGNLDSQVRKPKNLS